jgi:hypothetical protein
MRTVRGRFNGSMVVLEEPAPVQGEIEVTVTFPEVGAPSGEEAETTRRYWNDARSVYLRYVGTASDEVLRQRGRFDVTPSGLPEHMPSDEEWKERAARVSRMLRQWQSEEPSDDLATWQELKKGLDEHPVQFREIQQNQ